MARYEFDPKQLIIGGQDLTVHAHGVDLGRAHEHDAPSAPWGQYLAGLKQGTFSVGGFIDSNPRTYWPEPERTIQVNYLIPDGRWQAIKHWLKQRHLLPSWLKVRYRTYAFTGAMQPWPDWDGADIQATGPIERGTEHR